MTPTPEWVAADEDDEARAQSSFDRADNTARLALEVADLKRERTALVAEVDRLTSGAHNCLSTKAEAERADAAEAEVRDLRAKVAEVAALADEWRRYAPLRAQAIRERLASVGRTEPEAQP